MGANMARRLHERGFAGHGGLRHPRPGRRSLAAELGAARRTPLDDVSARARTIITVVSDDEAMREIFDAGSAHSLLAPAVAAGAAVHQLRDGLARRSITPCSRWRNSSARQSLEACMASSITQAREGSLYLMCGGKKRGVRPRAADSGPRSARRCVTSARRARRRRSRRWSTWS